MDRLLSLLGIAQKAGKIVSGGFLCEKAIKSREAKLVIIAEDAQKNTVSTISNKCTFYHIPSAINVLFIIYLLVFTGLKRHWAMPLANRSDHASP